MKKRSQVLLAVLATAVAGSAWADRLLVDQPAYQARLLGEMHCGQPVTVQVMTRNKGLYDTGNNEMQRLVDALHAMLGLECRDLPEIDIKGLVAGSTTPVYTASARRANDWLVAPPEAAGQVAATGTAEPANGVPFQVAGLSIGMTVDQVIAALRDNFPKPPVYDAAAHRLSAKDGGCPTDFDWDNRPADPKPGWRCLDVQFTDGPQPTLAQARLYQVAEGDHSAETVTTLADHFGKPASQTQFRRSDSDGAPVTRLIWGDTGATDGGQNGQPSSPPQPQMAAEVEGDQSITILTLSLTDADRVRSGKQVFLY